MHLYSLTYNLELLFTFIIYFNISNIVEFRSSNMRIVVILPTDNHYHTRQRKFLLWNVFKNNNTGIPLLAISRLREPNLQ